MGSEYVQTGPNETRIETWYKLRPVLEKRLATEAGDRKQLQEAAIRRRLAEKQANIQAQQIAYTEIAHLAAEKLHLAEENEKKEAERIRKAKVLRKKAIIASASLAIAGIAYFIYDRIPIMHENAASSGELIYWRTLSGRDGIYAKEMPQPGSHVRIRKQDGTFEEYLWYPKSSPDRPAGRTPDMIVVPADSNAARKAAPQRTR
ncbi:MAG: hypothetical protein LBB08_00700 [Rickettsiales bacterium]|nr:hypothetical protein [Rickettsiales bacterium]